MARFYTQAMTLRIKHLRTQKGWTQAELADRASMSRSQLAMIESETRPANTLRLNAIASALGVDPQDLFESEDAAQELAKLLRKMSDGDKAVLVRMAEALAAKSQSGASPDKEPG